ncbi:MAG: PHP domain-containing protein [Atopobiaceae bacterium]|jgi:histidinol-phosphatase (PHP family)|nr:PHP domain-containing protein [Atopobiaceae bacterium]
MRHEPTLIADTHTHTAYSDGIAGVEDSVVAAVAAGASVLAVTDHLTLPSEMDPRCEASVAEDDLPSLAADIERSRAAHPEIELVFGFECDWYEGCEEGIARWAAGATLLLGSVHWVSGRWMDDANDLSLWRELGPDEVWRRYAATWCEACESEADFGTMAHPDLAMRFANEGYRPTIDLRPLWEDMASCAHDMGRRIEVSTAGLRKSLGAYYPEPRLLEMFHDAEVPITIGSDAHRPQDVCWGIREAHGYARAAGYATFDVPHPDGSWTTAEL